MQLRLTAADAKLYKLLDTAIAEIERDPAWGAKPSRFLAPASSKTPGAIVDLSVRHYAIIYRIVDRGAHVRVLLIEPIFVG